MPYYILYILYIIYINFKPKAFINFPVKVNIKNIILDEYQSIKVYFK